MNTNDLPIPIHRLAFLQAYLYQVFTLEDQCKKSFENTEWYLNEEYNDKEVSSIIDYFKKNGLECDCDIIHKFDLQDVSKDIIKTHSEKI